MIATTTTTTTTATYCKMVRNSTVKGQELRYQQHGVMCPSARGSCAIVVPSARLPPINILLIVYSHEKQVVVERNKNKSYSFAVV